MTSLRNENPQLITTVSSVDLLGWPSDCFSIDFIERSSGQPRCVPPHSVLMFVPGNPGLMEWYLPFFRQVLEQLGPGYSCRGVANASHSVDPDKASVKEQLPGKASSIPWTVDGQALHKCAFVDHILDEYRQEATGKAIKLIFVSHSIGCTFTQRMCVLRPHILRQTTAFLHLMPFIRMKAPPSKARVLDWVAARPEMAIQVHEKMMQGLAALPLAAVDTLLINTINDQDGRRVAADLVRLPQFARNFFTLGCEEIREVPQEFDVCAFRLLSHDQRAVHLLFAGNDHWSPVSHLEDIETLQRNGQIPNNIRVSYKPNLQHDFVSNNEQIPEVAKYCVNVIRRIQQMSQQIPLSKL